jgi:hypothetical protein
MISPLQTIALIISAVVIPFNMATIANYIAQKAERENLSQKVECERPVTERKEYLDMR